MAVGCRTYRWGVSYPSDISSSSGLALLPPENLNPSFFGGGGAERLGLIFFLPPGPMGTMLGLVPP